MVTKRLMQEINAILGKLTEEFNKKNARERERKRERLKKE